MSLSGGHHDLGRKNYPDHLHDDLRSTCDHES